MLTRFLRAMLIGAAIVTPAFADGLKSAAILPGWIASDGIRIAGLVLELEDGWKTYWRSPGASGFPPQFDFSASRNVENISIEWPAPNIFGNDAFATIGYEKSVVLPLLISPKVADQDVQISLSADIGVCKDICIPTSFTLSQDILAKANSRPSALMASLANGPWSVDDLGIQELTCDLSADPNGFLVAISARTENLNQNTRIIVEYPSANVWVNNGLTSRKDARFQMQADVFVDTTIALARDRFVINFLSDGVWAQDKGCD